MTARKSKKAAKSLRVTLRRSPIGYDERQKATVRALGLRKVNSVAEHCDTPQVRGMIARVPHLVEVEEF